MVKILLVVLAGVAVAAIAGCGSSAPPSSAPSSQPAAPPATTAAALSCSTTLGDGKTVMQQIAQLVSDEKSQDAALQENWVDVVGGNPTSQGNDLGQAANQFQLAANDGTTLATDMSQLATDAQTFFNDQSAGLAPGWPAESHAIAEDIAALGGDCNIPYTVPSGYIGG